MPDIFLYEGAANPSDIILRDPTTAGSGSTVYTLVAQGGSYSYSGQSATLLKSKLLVASGGSYSFVGASVNITYTPAAVVYTLTALGGSYSLTGQSATLRRNRNLTASGGSYSLVGANATLLRSKRIVASGGAYSLVGANATLLKSKRIVAQGGSYSFVGSSVTITYTPTTPPSTTYRIYDDTGELFLHSYIPVTSRIKYDEEADELVLFSVGDKVVTRL
jgi:hypothetical protein